MAEEFNRSQAPRVLSVIRNVGRGDRIFDVFLYASELVIAQGSFKPVAFRSGGAPLGIIGALVGAKAAKSADASRIERATKLTPD